MSNKKHRTLMTLLASALITLCVGIALLLSRSENALATSPLTTQARFGFGASTFWGRNINNYPLSLAQLNAGWYLDWAMRSTPSRLNGIEYAQLISVSSDFTNWSALRDAILANPGSLWLIGNEPETRGQNQCTPEQYARRFYDLYVFIKSIDDTAQVAAGGIVQATPIRLHWLDEMMQAYREITPTASVDAWHIHEQILREDHGDWGCGVPISPTYVLSYTSEGLKPVKYLVPLYCTNEGGNGELVRCQWAWQGWTDPVSNQWTIPSDQTVAKGEIYNVEDNVSLALFKEHIQRFREWMKGQGQQDKPLIISEYGVLMPSMYLPKGNNSVIKFMQEGFRYMLSTTDESLGCPTDGHRLVQRWAWFGLNIHPDPWNNGGYNGSLAYWDRDELTVFGQAYKVFSNNAQPETKSIIPAAARFAPYVTQFLTTTYSDLDGVGDIDSVYLLINTNQSQKNAIYLRYNPNHNLLYLRNATDSGWLPTDGIALGSSKKVSNAYAELRARECRVVRSSDTVTMTWALAFKEPTIGQSYNEYLKVEDKLKVYEGWKESGTLSIAVPPAIEALTPTSGSCLPGVRQVFTTTFSDAEGANDLANVYLLVNKTLAFSNGLYARYDRTNNLISLADDSGVFGSGIEPGTPDAVLSNSYAALDVSSCAVAQNGNLLTVTWPVTFFPPFSGEVYATYLHAEDLAGAEAPWQEKGQWIVNVPPENGEAKNSGASQPNELIYLTVTYTDPDGYENIRNAYLLINTTPTTTKTVHLRYNRETGRVSIMNDLGTAWVPVNGKPIGGLGSLKNSYAVVKVAQCQAWGQNDTLTVTWRLKFKPSYSPKTYQQYLRVEDRTGSKSAWESAGEWTVNRTPRPVSATPVNTSKTAGSPYVFTTVYSDGDKWSDLQDVYLLITSTLPSTMTVPGPLPYYTYTNAVYLKYSLSEKKMFLRDKEDRDWLPVTPGNLLDEQTNGLVKLRGAKSKVTYPTIKTIQVQWDLEFDPAFAGLYNVYSRAVDKWGDALLGESGWQRKGWLQIK